jgi:restriction endonuclease S subunit
MTIDLFGICYKISRLFLLYSAKAAVPGIDRNDIHEIYVAAPQHDEQRQIAKYLDEQCDRINAITEKPSAASIY